MACESRLRQGQTFVARVAEVEKALERLEQYLSTGTVRIGVGPNGAVSFIGWQDRDDVMDVCAYRTLSAANSWALRQAVVKAEAMSGRKINPAAVAAGWHTHDHKNWSTH